MFDKTYSQLQQNLFLAYVMLDKTYFWLRLCWTKPIPGIGYADQNLIWDLVVKICKARCFPSRKIISEIKWYSFDKMFLDLVVVNFCCLFFFVFFSFFQRFNRYHAED